MRTEEIFVYSSELINIQKNYSYEILAEYGPIKCEDGITRDITHIRVSLPEEEMHILFDLLGIPHY